MLLRATASMRAMSSALRPETFSPFARQTAFSSYTFRSERLFCPPGVGFCAPAMSGAWTRQACGRSAGATSSAGRGAGVLSSAIVHMAARAPTIGAARIVPHPFSRGCRTESRGRERRARADSFPRVSSRLIDSWRAQRHGMRASAAAGPR